ncbi:acylphosphatase [Oceanobacillus sp. HCA-5259]|uniref:acylphosphatase n=1 Tax=Oceanobacillus sp. HCA-5259 TaxID=3134661 RepID=UPI0030BB67EC
MKEIKENWLPHLINAVPAAGFGKRLSLYTIALEGWRRGLKLKFFTLDDPENKLRIRYTLSSDEREHTFESSKGDKTTDLAYKICDNKYLTKEYLQKAGVPVAEGKSFSEDVSNDEIIEYANKLGYPLVIKPISANGGKGVVSNIENQKELEDALSYVRHELDYSEVIVESFVQGNEFRFIVVDNEVVGVLNRVPAHIVGNGKSTIRELIREKNEERRKNPHLKSRMIKIDRTVTDLLDELGYTLKSIPKEGEVVQLRLTSNLSTGGDSIELTDVISPELKKIAIEGTKAIPGLTVSGMDIMVDSDNKSGVIIEANTRPGLGGHLFPVEGTPKDIPKVIVDYYFPETKDVEKSSLYFDFNSILEPLINRTAKTVYVSPAPTGKVFGKKYIVYGKLQKVGYKVWIKRQALLHRLNGFMEDLEDGGIAIVVASPKKEDVVNFKEICEKGNGRAKITNIIEENFDEPVKIGFEINKTLSKEEIKELEEDSIVLEKERDYFKKKFTQIETSRMWRYTSPVRTVLDKIKGK